MRLLKQSSTAQSLPFLLVSSTDHIAGVTGLSPTVTLSKAGGSFASPSGAVTEIGNGWYKVAGNATDTNTLGSLILHATGTGADPVDVEFAVVAFDPQDSVRMGQTALPNADAEASGGLATLSAAQASDGTINVNVHRWLTGTPLALSSQQVQAVVPDSQKVDVNTIKTQAVTAAAGVTFPTDIASPTNITAGTITTVTNLTNAPTNGDFTATMKTSIGTAVAASAVASVTAGVTLADDAITASKFDESTAYPLKAADAGATYIARTGADGDTLETLSDQIDGVGGGSGDWTADEKTVIKATLGIPASGTTPENPTTGVLATIRDAVDVVDSNVDSILDDTGTSGVVVASGSKSGYSLTSGTGLGNQTADITGSLSGAVGSVTGDVGGKVLGGGSGTITGAGVTALLSNGTGTGQVSYLGNGVLNVNTERINGTIQTARDIGADTQTLVTRITSSLFTGITSLAQWLGLIAGKQSGNSTARTEIRATGGGSGTYDETTDSQEALRDRGDAAWTTATSVTVSDKTGFALTSDYDAAKTAATQTSVNDLPTNSEFATALDAIPTAAENASQVRTELTTELGRIDAAITTRLATAGYTAPLDAAGTRTAVGLASANLDDQLNALPTAAENATALLAAGDIDGFTVEKAMKIGLAADAGKLSGAATTTIAIRAADDSKDRITATVDEDGNRTAVTLDGDG